ncbi:MAG: ABC transporter permease [Deltaproteobacteria bacterium]|nr:ABC transporter permease [Deltaproteobacteria bacterium]
MNPVNVKAIARKEFYHLIRDFRSLYLAFFIPLLLILMFGYALSLDVNNVKIVIVDQDRTPRSRDLITKLGASSYFKIIEYLPDSRSATEYLDKGKTTMALIIPAGWTREIMSDRKASIQVILDGSDPNYAGLSRGYITAFIDQYNRDQLEDFIDRKGMDKVNPPVDGRIRIWFNEEMESRNFIVPGIIAIIIMIVGVILTSLVIAREYENGTMETILSLPVNAGEFLLGKAMPYFFIGLIDVLVAVLMGQVLFDVVMRGSFWLMVLASTIYLWVALSLGLLISVVTKAQLLANQIAILVSFLPSMLLSDFVFPIENMPGFLQLITHIVPAKYFINILSGLYLRNLGFLYLWQDYLVLTIMFLFLSNVAFIRLRKEGL